MESTPLVSKTQMQEQRGPKRLSVSLLWGIGVGSVIGGDFFGWNASLKGGVGFTLIAVTIMARYGIYSYQNLLNLRIISL